jgi:hypothetical protein
VLLTRLPLTLHLYCYKVVSVRLACVRHAASVSPEPGSNSPLNLTTTEPHVWPAIKVGPTEAQCQIINEPSEGSIACDRRLSTAYNIGGAKAESDEGPGTGARTFELISFEPLRIIKTGLRQSDSLRLSGPTNLFAFALFSFQRTDTA